MDTNIIKIINKRMHKLKDNICNQQINSCPICMLNNKDLDHFIFFNSNDIEVIQNRLIELDANFNFSESDIIKHKKHIYIKEESEINSEELINVGDKEIDEETNDIALINERIKKLKKEIEFLEKSNDNTSPQTSIARRRLNEFLELKRKYIQKDDSSRGLGETIDVHKLISVILKRE